MRRKGQGSAVSAVNRLSSLGNADSSPASPLQDLQLVLKQYSTVICWNDDLRRCSHPMSTNRRHTPIKGQRSDNPNPKPRLTQNGLDPHGSSEPF